MNEITLPRFTADENKTYLFEAPASKSILNRALLLSALAKDDVCLMHGAYSEDTRALADCIKGLGISLEASKGKTMVHGRNGAFNKSATLNVMSAGTAARFLPAVLAITGGSYRFEASEQMKKRPMEFLKTLEGAGVNIQYFEEKYHFPFHINSTGLQADTLTVNTDTSTQYASALLMAATASPRPITVRLTGGRTNGSYILMTLSLLNTFGASYTKTGDEITVYPPASAPEKVEIEADLSAACYFYALALVCRARVIVRHVTKNTLQGDGAFLSLLEEKGLKFTQTKTGLEADGRHITSFTGFDADFCDFSDQALTAAAIAPFATTPSRIRGIGHIRCQECDRITAALENLAAMGIKAEYENDILTVYPGDPEKAALNSFGDHRVAMAFALPAVKTGYMKLSDPLCCKKTFEGYFNELNKLYEKNAT